MEWMTDSNVWVVTFVGKNFILLGFAVGLLKLLAKRSEDTFDDSVVTYLEGFLNRFRRR